MRLLKRQKNKKQKKITKMYLKILDCMRHLYEITSIITIYISNSIIIDQSTFLHHFFDTFLSILI